MAEADIRSVASQVYVALRKLAVLETKFSASQDMLHLQAKEYERRLAELNHAHQQQIARNAEYVSREAWELTNDRIEEWRREIDRVRYFTIGAGAAAGAIVGIILRFFGR